MLYTVGRTHWTGDQPVARPLPTHRKTQTQNHRTQRSIPRVGFEPTIPVFEWAKTVHALDALPLLSAEAIIISIYIDEFVSVSETSEITQFCVTMETKYRALHEHTLRSR
jgi:hypothetical protein